MKRIFQPLLITLAIACLTHQTRAQMNTPAPGRPVNQVTDVGIDPKLNAQVPLDATFQDETGKTVRLGDLLGKKPTVLNLIFYRCTGSCLLEGEQMLNSFTALRFDLGKEYNAITVSINPKEGPSLAAEKKETYLHAYQRKVDPNSWKFLVGDKENINKLASAVGFRFVYDDRKDQIAHATGIMILSPEGRVTRYFRGVNYPVSELRLSLVEASEGKVGTVIDSVVLFCSQFDVMTGKRTIAIMNITKVAGILTVICLALSIGIMSFKHRRTPLKRPAKLAQTPGNGVAPS